jgi:hypothetical protein
MHKFVTQLAEVGIFSLERGRTRDINIFKYLKDWQIGKGLNLLR